MRKRDPVSITLDKELLSNLKFAVLKKSYETNTKTSLSQIIEDLIVKGKCIHPAAGTESNGQGWVVRRKELAV